MIDQKIFDFLSELKENNDRDWFNTNKSRYLDAKTAFDAFVNRIIPEINKFDDSIGLIEAKDCTFRIYRDIRFSKDKRPYKTNMGAYIARGGRKSMNPGYYIHVEPGASFLAGGVYMPPSDTLKKIREEIYYNVDEFKNIIHDRNFRKYFDGLEMNEKLKNPPKGYDKEWPDIDLLKYKSYAVMHRVPDDMMKKPGLLNYAMKVYKELHHLNLFLENAILH